MNDDRFSALDRHAVLTGYGEDLPWFAGAMLAMESGDVIRMRCAKLADGGEDAAREARLMVSEKIFAAIEAGASWLRGETAAHIIGRYREHVAANARRLAAG